MKQYKVVYESINGGSKVVIVNSESKEKAEDFTLSHYPDCLQVLTIS